MCVLVCGAFLVLDLVCAVSATRGREQPLTDTAVEHTLQTKTRNSRLQNCSPHSGQQPSGGGWGRWTVVAEKQSNAGRESK